MGKWGNFLEDGVRALGGAVIALRTTHKRMPKGRARCIGVPVRLQAREGKNNMK